MSGRRYYTPRPRILVPTRYQRARDTRARFLRQVIAGLRQRRLAAEQAQRDAEAAIREQRRYARAATDYAETELARTTRRGRGDQGPSIGSVTELDRQFGIEPTHGGRGRRVTRATRHVESTVRRVFPDLARRALLGDSESEDLISELTADQLQHMYGQRVEQLHGPPLPGERYPRQNMRDYIRGDMTPAPQNWLEAANAARQAGNDEAANAITRLGRQLDPNP